MKKTNNFVPDVERIIRVYLLMPFSEIGVSVENDRKIYFLIDVKNYFAIEGNLTVD